MLSDFDLAKQSGEPGGKPATIHQEENGVRYFSILFELSVLAYKYHYFLFVDTINRYAIMHGRFPY